MPAECQFLLKQHAGSVHCVRLTHDGAYCMTAGEDKTLRLWNPHKSDPREQLSIETTVSSSSSRLKEIPSALCVQTYGGVHGYKVLDVCISQDKSKFASGGDDRSVYFWDVGTSRVLRRFQAHLQRTNAVMFNQDDSVLFSASNDKTVKCWDLRAQNSRDPIDTLEGSTDSITTIARHDNAIITGSVDGGVRIYDLRKSCMQTDRISSSPITSLSISDDGRMYLISCLEASPHHHRYPRHPGDSLSLTGAYGVVRLLDIATGQLFREYRGHVHQSVKVEARFVSDGKQVVAGSEDGRIVHWDLLQTTIADETVANEGSRLQAANNSISGSLKDSHRHSISEEHAISSLSYHPNEETGMFVSASYDGLAKVWKTTHSV